jgi:hypothetical protein
MKFAGVYAWAIVFSLIAITLPGVAAAEIELADVDWRTTTGGTMVEFQLTFYNPGPGTSQPTLGELWAQSAFGVFVDNHSLIDSFQVPPFAVDSFFDVFIEIEMLSLPPSAEETHPGGSPSPPADTWTVAQVDSCNPDDHWDGNVDIFWAGPGGTGQVFKHFGTLHTCPGAGNSYIHVVTDCTSPASWVINGVCPNFSATLVNEDLTPASNPVPPGWSGWICVSAGAGVPIGTQCCFTVDFTCATQTGTIDLCAEACPCQPTALEETSWGRIKTLHR